MNPPSVPSPVPAGTGREEILASQLVETDALTASDPETLRPESYVVAADDVPYLIQTVLALAAVVSSSPATPAAEYVWQHDGHEWGSGCCSGIESPASSPATPEGGRCTDDVANLMERQLEVLRERDALQRRIDSAYEALFPAVSLPVHPFNTEGA